MLIQSVPRLWDQEAQPLPTSGLLSYLHERLNRDEERFQAKSLARLGVSLSGPPGAPAPLASNFLARNGGLILVPSSRPHFLQVGNCLFALVFGLVGGGVAAWFHRTSPLVSRLTHDG
jgi:hypothetical protein